MAKQQKSGLGRGLSSLIGSSYEESAQAQTAAQAAAQGKTAENTTPNAAAPKSAAATRPQDANRELVETPEEIRELHEALIERAKAREERLNAEAESKKQAAAPLTEPAYKATREAAPAPAAPSASGPIPVVAEPEKAPAEAKQEAKPQPEPEPSKTAADEEVQIAEEHVTIKGVATRETETAKPATATPRVEEPAEAVVEVGENRLTASQMDERFESTHPSDEVSIDAIVPNPNQPRTNFKSAELDELAGSIERDGLLQPILVREISPGSYQIIAGERRWQACKQLGMKTVPVRIREASDNEALEMALVENIQRSDLNPIEEAWGYRRLMEKRGLTQAQLAQALSKGRSTIANSLRLLELPEDAQQLLFEEKITAGHARAILSVPTTEGRQKLAEKLVAEKLSVRETENLARLMSAKKPPKGTPRATAPKAYALAARALKAALETNVKVKTVQGKSKVEIEFKDEKDLQRIVRAIVGDVADQIAE